MMKASIEWYVLDIFQDKKIQILEDKVKIMQKAHGLYIDLNYSSSYC